MSDKVLQFVLLSALEVYQLKVMVREIFIIQKKLIIIPEKSFSRITSRGILVVPGWSQGDSRGPKKFYGFPKIRRGLKGFREFQGSQGSQWSWGVPRVPGLGPTFPPCQIKIQYT